jgi:hypothetical protein
MKGPIFGKNISTIFVTVVIAIILLLIFGCVFGFFCILNRKSESFDNGCVKDLNYDDSNFKNERFFHYDNIDKLVSSDPIHVSQGVLGDALLNGQDVDKYFGDAKKKRQ